MIYAIGIFKKKPKPRVKLKVAAKGVAQRKLQLVKTPKNSLPRHPMPFAAKNMYYDERWIEKQEEGRQQLEINYQLYGKKWEKQVFQKDFE